MNSGNEPLVRSIRELQSKIREEILTTTYAAFPDDLAEVVGEETGDTIYAIDRVSEERLRELFRDLSEQVSFVLIGEGLTDGGEVFPEGIREEDADFRIIVDPIDGTRGLMYDKRSAWILTGVAPNRGGETSLQDIFLAVQSEIPTKKQDLCDVLWGVKGEGWGSERVSVRTGVTEGIQLCPSQASEIEHGFAMISRFFPGGKQILAEVEEALVESLIGPVTEGRARLFEDQYISTGGQLYELIAGHDRFNADLRPNLEKRLRAEGKGLGICCHPYDICTVIIAEEAGVIVTTPEGGAIDPPLDTSAPVAWVAYANDALRSNIEPRLQEVLREFGLL